MFSRTLYTYLYILRVHCKGAPLQDTRRLCLLPKSRRAQVFIDQLQSHYKCESTGVQVLMNILGAFQLEQVESC